jgi:peptide subunit release factor RF-3
LRSTRRNFFAQDLQLADEAFAGDVVGIPNYGLLRIGDTLGNAMRAKNCVRRPRWHAGLYGGVEL